MTKYAPILLLLATLVGCESRKNQPLSAPSAEGVADDGLPTLADALLNNIREPASGQFATPESVVAHALNAIRNHDVDEYLRCVPVRKLQRTHDLKFLLRDSGAYSPPPIRIPGSDYLNIQKTIGEQLEMFYRVAFDVFMKGDSLEARTVDPETAEGRENIDKVLSQFNVDRLKQLKPGEIQIEKRGNAHIGNRHKVLGVSELVVFRTSLKDGGHEMRLWGIAGKIDDHWRILSAYEGN